MTDTDFQQMLELLADEPPAVEVFEQLDPEALTVSQRRELALFLRAQARLQHEIEGGDAFAHRVMSWAQGQNEAFTAQVMRAHQPAPRRNWRTLLPWALATAACVVAALSWWPTPGSTRRAANEGDGAVAVLVDEVQARFQSSHAPQQSGFAPGHYTLEEGLAHLRMVNGTDLVLKAPMTFEIENAMRVRLRHGDMRVVVPEMAKGFIVATQAVDYQDLGTEFGVSAADDGKASSMHVFDGQVDVLKDGAKMNSVTLGQSVAFADGKLTAAPAPAPDRYPSANELGRRRWQLLSQQWRRDPSLVAYYAFERQAQQPHVLADVKTQGQPLPGTIHGARWVSGRWPGTGALFFDRDDDYVEVEIPGEHTAFTVAAWLLLDRLEFQNNAIFASDGWEQGDFHMNLTAYGKPFGGAWPRSKAVWDERKALQPGVWTLVVLTVDQTTKTTLAWINGHLATKGNVEPPIVPLKPGTCRIGSCKVRSDEANPVRTLRGRIDELFVWGRALKSDEVSKLYEAGRPTLLESPRKH